MAGWLVHSKTFTLSSAATATNRVDSCHQRHLGLYPRKASPGEAVGETHVVFLHEFWVAEILAGSQNWQSPHDLGKRDRASIGTCAWNWWLFFFPRDFMLN